MEALEDRETSQARDVSILDATVPDRPELVDTAMRRRAAEYQGPPTPEDPGGAAWWHKVALLAAHH